MNRIAATVVALLAAGGILLAAVPTCMAAEIGLASPMGVTIPKGYRDWQVVAPSQRDDTDEIRVILGNSIAMKAFRANTLPFPDGTILAKLAWKRVKSTEFPKTFIPGVAPRIEFMVKNSKKYASTGGWGFGRFIDGKPADAQVHATCFPCHQANVKDHDFVFTRYAP
ncbi:MAG TPA: cytochrome P460 family protein [Candidatus Deferrimicrobium sp.]